MLQKNILIINSGSSSIKFAIYSNELNPICKLSGKVDKIGLQDPILSYAENTDEKKTISVKASNIPESISSLIEWLLKRNYLDNLIAVGHRIVHGMEISATQMITPELIERLKNISSYDPDHLPGEIELINAFQQKLPKLIQVACFDTLFHTSMPSLATMLPIPRKYFEQGIRKYGFHGLSYSFIIEKLKNLGEPAVIKGRIIIMHLGNGASLAAVKDGKSVDTSMGFTPAGGLIMGTRTGDMDPGITSVIMKKESMNPIQFNDFVNHDCGLLGISQTTSDMQQLLKNQSTDNRAVEAVSLFCYQVKKWIGSFTAVLDGVDVLVFTGGIGENAPVIRQRICRELSFLGLQLDEKKNQYFKGIISSKDSRIIVYVIPTNEELMIAKLVNHILAN